MTVGGFSFGVPSSTTSPTSSAGFNFSFGQSSTPSPPSGAGFNFGGGPATASLTTATPSSSNDGVFHFGSVWSSRSTTNPDAGSTTDPSPASTEPTPAGDEAPEAPIFSNNTPSKSKDDFFEINIAVLGNVSAGKTTLLNALFCDKYGEVSMKRTTAGINFFRVHSKRNSDTSDEEGDSSSEISIDLASPPQTNRSAESILKEISADNVKLRKDEYIQEKVFDIELKEELFPMRKDTKLVFVDVPGINEANTVNKYKNYVSEMWTSFDGVIVVMDARQGVNTEDQVSLLHFVRKMQFEKKDIPVIVLCNKVDDPKEEEQAELVKEARDEVEKIFKSPLCREKALQLILEVHDDPHNERKARELLVEHKIHRSVRASNAAAGLRTILCPAFIPVSAIHAFIHQSASLMTRKGFEKFDCDLLEKLGREQIGRRRWNRMSEQEKRDEAFKVVKEGYQDGMQDSNFDKLLTVLDYFFGGNKTQQSIIEFQIRTSVRLLSKRPFPPGGITSLVRGLHAKRNLLQGSETTYSYTRDLDLVQSFWDTYTSFEDEAFEHLEKDFPSSFRILAEPMNELVRYSELTRLFGWNDTSSNVCAKMKTLVKRYVAFLLKKRQEDREIKQLSPYDWHAIWGSFLLLSYSKVFCQTFGQEKITIDSLVQESNNKLVQDANSLIRRRCPGCANPFSGQVNTTICKNVSGTFHVCRPCKKTFSIAKTNEIRACSGCDQITQSSSWGGRNTCPKCGCASTIVMEHQVEAAAKPVQDAASPHRACPNCSKSLKKVSGTCEVSCDLLVECCRTCMAVYPTKRVEKGTTIKNHACASCNNSNSKESLKQAGDVCPHCKKASRFHNLSPPLNPAYNKSGVLVPVLGSDEPTIRVPEQLSDTSHVAHIVWKFCEFTEGRDKNV